MTITETLYDRLNRVVAWNDRHGVPEAIRMLKIIEEAGEAAQAYLGYTGSNPRKGVTNGADEVRKELADTAITALVAIATLGGDPMSEVYERLGVVLDRIGEAQCVCGDVIERDHNGQWRHPVKNSYYCHKAFSGDKATPAVLT
jgi:NTP pyrophosphatase (non-canonical NTP hydrolase)